jgi:lipopolysaccharide/colanic/teichoic acid biosynthesis glycosyltransferase
MLAEDEAPVREPAKRTVALSLVSDNRAYAAEERSKLSVPWYRFSKRLLDIVLGSVLLCCSLPIILLAAIAIRMESSGNPLFIQTRVGLNGKPFRLFKLRGMYADARERFPELYDYSKYGDLDFHFHYEVDPRITRVGSFIRKTSIDELPNFLNVVLGSMTLVGPRPEIPDVSALYGKYRGKYLSVKPGVTCLSKVTGRDLLTKEQTIRTDITYIENMSVAMDLRILWATFWSVINRRNVFGRVSDCSKKSWLDICKNAVECGSEAYEVPRTGMISRLGSRS